MIHKAYWDFIRYFWLQYLKMQQGNLANSHETTGEVLLFLPRSWKWRMPVYERQRSYWRKGNYDPVDGRNPANQLRLVAYLIIYRVLYIPNGAGFLNHQHFYYPPSWVTPTTYHPCSAGHHRLHQSGHPASALGFSQTNKGMYSWQSSWALQNKHFSKFSEWTKWQWKEELQYKHIYIYTQCKYLLCINKYTI